MNKIELSNTDRSMMRDALLQAGVKTRGMDDETINTKYEEKFGNDEKPAPIEAKPAPVEVEAKPIPKTNGDTPPASNDIGKAIQDAINAGLAGYSGSMDEKRVLELIQEYAATPLKVTHLVQVKRAGKKPVEIDGAHPALVDVIDWLSVNENVYMVGGAGTGKTSMAEQAAKALGLEFWSHGAIFEAFQLFGFVDANGTYHKTPFYEACKNGGVCLFDECDSGYPAPLNSINQAIENGYVIFPNGERLTIDWEKTKFIACANTIGLGANAQFVGRNPLDGAFLDRFKQVEVDYDLAIEFSMARSAWKMAGGADDGLNIAESWAQTVIDFRKLLADRGIKAIVSTRATRGGAKVLAKGWSVEKVKNCELYKHLNANQRKQLGV